jgi:hypothetical protein
MRNLLLALVVMPSLVVFAPADEPAHKATPDEVLDGLRAFWKKTAQPDGSFRPGIDPDYKGMSDSAFSDLAPLTYAVTLHKTFGWKLPYEEKTIAHLLGRQKDDGAFVHTQGTGDPKGPQARLYNTTQGLVALHALGAKPKYNALPVFEQILEGDHEKLPVYTTSFFPLAYQCLGKPFPSEQDSKIRALMKQADDGYVDDHIAATFHLVHYDRLVGAPVPRADAIVERILKDQKADGSFLLNPPARSDADATYFQVGTLVLAGYLKPVEPMPKDPQLLSWGHVFPRP